MIDFSTPPSFFFFITAPISSKYLGNLIKWLTQETPEKILFRFNFHISNKSGGIKFKITIEQGKNQNVADEFISEHRVSDKNNFIFLIFVACNEEFAEDGFQVILMHSHFFT